MTSDIGTAFGQLESVSSRAQPVAAVILAAGRSTRMRSKLPKSLHPICGLPMTSHVMRACREAGVERLVVVVGHQAEAVQNGLGGEAEYVLQERQNGTGDAVRAAQPLLGDWQGSVLVLAGDVPLLSGATLKRLIDLKASTDAAVVMLTAVQENPTGYGRILRDDHGKIVGIVEERDADEAQKQITECNPSLYLFESGKLWTVLSRLKPNNDQGEFYLTDTIRLLSEQGESIEAVVAADSREVLGVNTRVELAAAAQIMRQRILEHLMLSGVSITDPANTYVEVGVEVGQDTVIEPNTFLLGRTQIGEECVIGPFSRLQDAIVGNQVRILASHITESVVSDRVMIGPYAHLRPGSSLGSHVRIGNFVEVKNATLGAEVRASHLSYLGDADIGEGANIGAGTITCNYDGYEKRPTMIGRKAFIGSNSTLVAPVTIEDGAFIAAASVITEDVPQNALGIARSRQTNKEGWAAEYHRRHAKDESE